MARPTHGSRSPSARQPGAGRRRRDDPPELIAHIRSALAAKHPLPLLHLASGVVDFADARDRDPFAPDGSNQSEISELTASFLAQCAGDDGSSDRLGALPRRHARGGVDSDAWSPSLD